MTTALDLNLSGVLDAESVNKKKSPRQTKRSVGGKQPLYFDLETIPDESRMELFGLDPLPVLSPETPAENLMSPELFLGQSLADIKTWLGGNNPPVTWMDAVENAERRQAKPRKGLTDCLDDCRNQATVVANAAADRQKLMSVTPEFNRIVAVGLASGSDEVETMIVEDGGLEADLTEWLWSRIEMARPIVGFNVLWFDLPTLFVRSAILGIKPTMRIDMKPWGTDVTDLAKVRFPTGIPKGMGLKTLAKLYGIPVPAGETDGGDVLQMWRDEPKKLKQYVASDVLVTRDLHRFMRGYFCS